MRAIMTIVAGMATLEAQIPAGPLPPLPLTQLDERALAADLDNQTFTFSFPQPVPVREALLLLVRGTSLSVIPDPAITGSFAGELKNVTVRQALDLMLPAVGLDYSVDGGFVRVFPRERETRMFDINYVATRRTSHTEVGARDREGAEGSLASIAATTGADLFDAVADGLRTVLSQGATYNLDRKAGLLQVTDFPQELEAVGRYLEAVHERVNRQVQLDARILEVELGAAAAQTLDWEALAGLDAASRPAAGRPMLTRLDTADIPRFLEALAAQGAVTVLATPRLRALNNEPALVRAVSEVTADEDGGRPRVDDVTLAVTSRIGPDGVIMLSLSPIVSIHEARPDEDAPLVAATREADMVVRLAAGETLILGGFTREREVRERRPPGIGGGWLGRATVVTRKRLELVILLTPTIVGSPGTR
jgi:type II secretory pathway component GspD/PulD (secretin)